MKSKLPSPASDAAAQRFVETADLTSYDLTSYDLTSYDLSAMTPVRFEFARTKPV